jgi:predicted enzyme related to lactoylglutathione lyase
MANPFVHVELHTKDLPKARQFYSGLFGWELQDMPMPGGGGSYTMINGGAGIGGE